MRLNPAGPKPRIGRQRPAKARLFLAVASGLAVLAAAGCSASGAAGGSISRTITIAAVPGIDDAPLYLAKHDGLFAAAGLQHVVILPESQESNVFSALHGNRAQIAAADYGDILYQQSHKSANSAGYKILADGYDAPAGTLEVLTMPKSPIKSPAQLEGATVAVPNDDKLQVKAGSPVSLEAAAATEVLQNYVGMAPSTVKWDPMPEASEIAALKDGRVQAILVGQPYVFEAEQDDGAVELMDVASGFTANLPLSGYVATSSWAKQNPAAVADFQSALAKAQADASMSGPVQSVLPHYMGVSSQVADLATIGSYPTTTSATEIARVENMLSTYHMISASPSIAQMVLK